MIFHRVDNVGGLLYCRAYGWHGLGGVDESVCHEVGGIFVFIRSGRYVFVGLLARADAGKDDSMCHGVGGLIASSVGRGRCEFVGLLTRADAGENDADVPRHWWACCFEYWARAMRVRWAACEG